jgi:hypothetical protein
VLHARGTISGAFAVPAGWGDIAVATGALAVVYRVLPVTDRAGWWIVLLWNVFGLLDILFVLRTGIGLGLDDPRQMLWITGFPWSLIPTFIVPLIIVTHVLIFVRLGRLRRTWTAQPHPTGRRTGGDSSSAAAPSSGNLS